MGELPEIENDTLEDSIKTMIRPWKNNENEKWVQIIKQAESDYLLALKSSLDIKADWKQSHLSKEVQRICDANDFLKYGKMPQAMGDLPKPAGPLESLQEELGYKQKLRLSPYVSRSYVNVGPKGTGIKKKNL